MAVIISDDVLNKVHMTGEELLIDLACYLYDKEQLSFGKCSELSGLNYLKFQQALAKRNIDIKYSEEDLNTDLSNLGINL